MRTTTVLAGIVVALLAVAVPAAGQGVEDPAGMACADATDEAQCTLVAVSGAGDATATCGLEAPVCPTVAVSGLGDATAACTFRTFFGYCASVAAAGAGDADGAVALSGTGDASSCPYYSTPERQYLGCVALAGDGRARGPAAVSAFGPARGYVAVSLTEDADAPPVRPVGVGASGTGDASNFVAVSATGNATGTVSLSGTGHADGAVAASGCEVAAEACFHPNADGLVAGAGPEASALP